MEEMFYELSKYFPKTIENLSGYDAMLLRDEHFETESCANCSKHGFYIRDKNGKLVLGDGDFHGCTLDGMASYIDFSPSAETLKAVDALKWYSACWDMDQYLRSQTKYAPDDMPEEVYEALTKTREKLHQILGENSVDFND